MVGTIIGGADTQTLLAVKKNSNFMHFQVVGTQKLTTLALTPTFSITSHLVKLSLPNIYYYRLCTHVESLHDVVSM